MARYTIVETRDAEGRQAYQLGRDGEEPRGQLYYSKRAARNGIKYFESLERELAEDEK